MKTYNFIIKNYKLIIFVLMILNLLFCFPLKSKALEQNYSIDLFSFTYEETSGLNCSLSSKTKTLSNNFTQFIDFYDSDSSSCSAPSLAKTLGMNVSTQIQSGYYYTITQRFYFNGAIQYQQNQVNTYTQCGVYSGGWNMNACENVVVTSSSPNGGYVDIKVMFKSNISGTKYTLTIGSLNTGYSMFYTVGNGGQFRLNNLIVESSPDPILGAIGSINQQQNTIIEQNKETNEKLDDIESSLKDSTPPSEDELNILNGAAGWLPPGPVDSILTLPLTMMESISNNLGKQCSPLNFTLPYINEKINLPCFNSFIYNTNFDTLWNWFGTISGAFLLYYYLLSLYKWVDNTLQFRENNYIDNWGGV